jgi:ABC-2 type transport system permease protein
MPPADPPRSALLELTLMRLREFLREKEMLFWVFAFPILMAFGLGYAFRSHPVEPPRVAVVAAEDSGVARMLLSSPKVRSKKEDLTTARRQLTVSQVDLVVRLDQPHPVYLYDQTQEKGPLARLVVDDLIQRHWGRTDPVTTTEQFQTEPGSRYIDFLVPGLIALNLMSTSMWGVGYNLVLARKRRLLRRFAVTPMHRSQFLLSYFLSRSVFLVLEVSALVLFGMLVFGTVVRGNIVTLAVVAFAGAAAFAGISLLIGARVENTESANGWMNLVQLPMWVLSGCFFSYQRFPEWLHTPIRLLPLTALANGLRAVFNEGRGLADLWFELLVLLVWGASGYLVALRTFRWQ